MSGDIQQDILFFVVIILAGIAAAAILIDIFVPDELTDEEIKKLTK